MKLQIGNPRNITTLKETQKLAERLGSFLRKGDCIALSGDLGAGKTTFVRFLLKALNPSIEEVPSPTFTLVQIYETTCAPIYHFDCYRLKNAEDLIELGFQEACQEGTTLLEWPEKIEAFLPQNALWVYFMPTEKEEGRRITFMGNKTWQERLSSL